MSEVQKTIIHALWETGKTQNKISVQVYHLKDNKTD